MLFNWPLNGCKLIFISILPSNSHFSENRERAEGEGDAPAHRERERERDRERERERGRRERGRSVHRPTSNPFDFAVRLRPLTSPFDFTFAPITIAIAAPIRRPRSRTQNRSSSLPSSLNLIGLWFFFPGFYLCFCVILILVVVVVWWWCFGGCGFWLPEFAAVGWIAVWKICRKIAFSTIQPNTRKYFS